MVDPLTAPSKEQVAVLFALWHTVAWMVDTDADGERLDGYLDRLEKLNEMARNEIGCEDPQCFDCRMFGAVDTGLVQTYLDESFRQ